MTTAEATWSKETKKLPRPGKEFKNSEKRIYQMSTTCD